MLFRSPSVSAVVSRANEPIVVNSDLSDVGEGNEEGNLQDESESEADEVPDASDKSERSDKPDDDSDEEEEVGVQGAPTTPRTLPIRSGRQLNSPVRVRGMLKRLGNAGRSPTVIGHMEAKTTRGGVRGQPKEGDRKSTRLNSSH